MSGLEVCTWTLRTLVESLVDTGELMFAFYLDNQVDGKLATGGVDNAHYQGRFRVHELRERQVNPVGLKPNDAAVATEFVTTVPFLGYYSSSPRMTTLSLHSSPSPVDT